jgi:predicted nucleic acid-binding protein
MAARTRRQVDRVAAFWDASALVPLCVRQTLTSRVRSLYNAYEVTVWWTTPVEIASALARLLRLQQINAQEITAARKLGNDLSETWWVVQPSDILRASALALVERYDLRAADSLQLAAAIEWCEHQPHGRVFLTADQRLRDAALRCGFETGHL